MLTEKIKLVNVYSILTLLMVGLSSCGKVDLKIEVPKCVEKKINKSIESDEAMPQAVWEWKVDGKTYYYFSAQCCDQLNKLFDSDCNYVCAPDGGFSGSGDGNCPGFEGQIERTLVWEKE